ncbi:MAG: hypothetical protein KDN22_24785 [Verrucomicrobiae bacterium]|nr:hypothetical protein [Verrucomicrobiae bacterium]
MGQLRCENERARPANYRAPEGGSFARAPREQLKLIKVFIERLEFGVVELGEIYVAGVGADSDVARQWQWACGAQGCDGGEGKVVRFVGVCEGAKV